MSENPWIRPHAPVVIAHRGQLDPGVRLVSKPYRKDELSRQLRAALEARS